VATQPDRLIKTDPTDTGWVKPKDQLQSLGLSLVASHRNSLGAVSNAQVNARLVRQVLCTSPTDNRVWRWASGISSSAPKELACAPPPADDIVFLVAQGRADEFCTVVEHRPTKAPLKTGPRVWRRRVKRCGISTAAARPPTRCRTMNLVLAPPVAHVDPAWYGVASTATSRRAPREPELQRAARLQCDWMQFNQRREPW
jgi:hypothetical protein